MRLAMIGFTGVLLAGCVTGQISSAEPLRKTFEKVSPAVVVVKAKHRQLTPLRLPDDKNRFVSVMGLGSGVIVRIDRKALVFTAAHVVQAADELYVELADGRKIGAKTVASSPAADVALLELETAPRDVTPARIGDSDQVGVGDRVFVVGAPYGLSSTLTVGHISARRKSSTMLGAMAAMEVLQTDAAINTGNSGGPMFNMEGQVIGIVSHILSRSGGFEGTGFAVPSNLAKRLLLDEPTFWSGMEAYMLTEDLAKVFNLPQKSGLLVQRVARDSPAHNLGLRPGTLEAEIEGQKLVVGGDVVLAVAEISIEATEESYHRIRDYIRELRSDHRLVLKVLRAGKIIELTRFKSDL